MTPLAEIAAENGVGATSPTNNPPSRHIKLLVAPNWLLPALNCISFTLPAGTVPPIVIVATPLALLATTPAPTKLIVLAVDITKLPSSFIVIPLMPKFAVALLAAKKAALAVFNATVIELF